MYPCEADHLAMLLSLCTVTSTILPRVTYKSIEPSHITSLVSGNIKPYSEHTKKETWKKKSSLEQCRQSEMNGLKFLACPNGLVNPLLRTAILESFPPVISTHVTSGKDQLVTLWWVASWGKRWGEQPMFPLQHESEGQREKMEQLSPLKSNYAKPVSAEECQLSLMSWQQNIPGQGINADRKLCQ